MKGALVFGFMLFSLQVSLFSDEPLVTRADTVRFEPSRRLLLVSRPVVVKQLGLTVSEEDAVRQLVSEHSQNLIRLLKETNEKGLHRQKDLEQHWDKTDELANDYLEAIKKAIAADKYQRLQQIHWQLLGGEALLDPDVAREINLSDEQRSRVMQVLKDYLSKRRLKNVGALRQGPFVGGDDLQEERDTAIMELLSPTQRQSVEALKGPDVDLVELRQQLAPRRQRARNNE